MENASQALIISGTILIALLVISVGVYLVVSYSKVSESYGQTQATDAITKFNANFTKFINREDILAQEIITLKNFAQNYDNENGTKTTVVYPKISSIKPKEDQDAEFIKAYEPKKTGLNTVEIQYFKCEKCEDKNEDGRIDYIKFVKK